MRPEGASAHTRLTIADLEPTLAPRFLDFLDALKRDAPILDTPDLDIKLFVAETEHTSPRIRMRLYDCEVSWGGLVTAQTLLSHLATRLAPFLGADRARHRPSRLFDISGLVVRAATPEDALALATRLRSRSRTSLMQKIVRTTEPIEVREIVRHVVQPEDVPGFSA